jgi:hypothetical protein
MAGRKNFPSNIERKQTEAAERREVYSKLTDRQKLDRLDHGGFVAERERLVIFARIKREAQK